MLRDLGFVGVTGLDRNVDAIRFCAEKGLGNVRLGDVCNLPFPDDFFDLVLATDIFEHVSADDVAMEEIRRVLKPDGHLLLTVPTFQLLWGLQDDVSHHQRRYRMPALLGKLRLAGLHPQRHFYFNYLLFLPILVARRVMQLLRVRLASENNLNPAWLNKVLLPLFLIDIRTAGWLRPPVGVSALVVASPLPSTKPIVHGRMQRI
jgi:SAM-dependent methyltransferase